MLSLGEHLLRGRNYVLSVGSLKERENIGKWDCQKEVLV